MGSYIDLHTHTTNSDGAFSPQELIDKARTVGIGILAITDHNKLLPNLEELQESNPDIRLIRASEISATHIFRTGRQAEIHIVGLLLDKTDQLTRFLEGYHSDGKGRAAVILQKLKENCGIDLGTYEEIQALFSGKRIGRMQLAEVLTARGYSKNVSDAFDTYVGDYGRRLAWAPSSHQYSPISEVTAVIREAHGIPVLAHSFSYRLDDAEFRELLETFKASGGEAIEVEYAKYNSEQRSQLAATAEKWKLLPSCASDFHGSFEEDSLENHFAVKYFNAIEERKKTIYK